MTENDRTVFSFNSCLCGLNQIPKRQEHFYKSSSISGCQHALHPVILRYSVAFHPHHIVCKCQTRIFHPNDSTAQITISWSTSITLEWVKGCCIYHENTRLSAKELKKCLRMKVSVLLLSYYCSSFQPYSATSHSLIGWYLPPAFVHWPGTAG